MYMRVADRTMTVRPRTDGMAEVIDPDTGRPFCAPITWGEAGVYRHTLTASDATVTALMDAGALTSAEVDGLTPEQVTALATDRALSLC